MLKRDNKKPRAGPQPDDIFWVERNHCTLYFCPATKTFAPLS